MKNNFKKQEGVILVLSLMMMTVLLSIAFGFGIFILSDLRQANQIDNSVVAYYAADTGIEQTLFLFRKMGVSSISELDGINKSGDINGDGNNDWDINNSTDYEPTFFRQRLLNGQSAKLYFLGREDGTNTSKSIKIEWYKGEGTSPKLQVVFTQLTPSVDSNGALVYDTDTSKVEISDTLAKGAPVCYDFKENGMDYIVELRAVGVEGDYIDRIVVTAHNKEKGVNNCNTDPYNTTYYNPQAISNITIKSVGTHNGASQEIYASIPPFDPVSGLLGFVLFSDEDITKGY